MQRLRNTTIACSALLCALMLQGCTTARMTSQWHDNSHGAGLPAGSRVLVVCQTGEQTLRRLCEDGWSERMRAEGMTAVRGYGLPGVSSDPAPRPEQALQAARASNSAALIVMKLASAGYTVAAPGAQVGVGIGGGSGGFSYGGIGISLPIGGSATTRPGLASDTTLTDSVSGVVVWSGGASSHANTNAAGQLEALTRVTVDAMKQSGLLR